MATVVLNPDAQKFPAGATVKAYKRSNFTAVWDRTGAPAGSQDASATVAADGSVTFAGLDDATEYLLYAASPDRYASFVTPAAAATVVPDDASVTTAKLGPAAVTGAKLAPETVNAVASSGAAQTLPDVTAATIHRITLDANCTLTFPAAAAGKRFTVVLVQDATASRLVTWPASVKWSGGTTPTLTTTAAKKDVFTFVCADGTTWLGATAGLNFA